MTRTFNPSCRACRRAYQRRIPAFAGGSNWPIYSGSNILNDIGTVTGTSTVTALTANSTANTKGTTYTELIASTTRPYVGLHVFVQSNSASQARALIDLAIGAAASEVIVIPDLFFWSMSSNALRAWTHYYFPIAIPSGVRLSMRAQSSTASWALRVGVLGVPVNPLVPVGFTRCTAYGATTADSGGIAIDSGATANTKGAYAVVSASTTNPMKAMIAVILGSSLTVPATAATILVDVSIGAAAAEQPVFSNYFWNRAANVSAETEGVCSLPLGVNIPAATMLTSRCQASGTDAQARLQDVVVYGFD